MNFHYAQIQYSNKKHNSTRNSFFYVRLRLMVSEEEIKVEEEGVEEENIA